MLLFRSEDDVERWASTTGHPRGESGPLMTVWWLGADWYSDRLGPNFRGMTKDRVRSIFEKYGLVSDFWRVPD